MTRVVVIRPPRPALYPWIVTVRPRWRWRYDGDQYAFVWSDPTPYLACSACGGYPTGFRRSNEGFSLGCARHMTRLPWRGRWSTKTNEQNTT